MAQIVTHEEPRSMCFRLRPLLSDEEPRSMCFRLRPLLSDEDGDRWQWTVYSYPDFAVLRDGQTAGIREKAERAARVAIWALGGAVESLETR